MTNYERIKAMSVEEMAEKINKISIIQCMFCADKSCAGTSTSSLTCLRGIKYWLNSESEEQKCQKY